MANSFTYSPRVYLDPTDPYPFPSPPPFKYEDTVTLGELLRQKIMETEAKEEPMATISAAPVELTNTSHGKIRGELVTLGRRMRQLEKAMNDMSNYDTEGNVHMLKMRINDTADMMLLVRDMLDKRIDSLEAS